MAATTQQISDAIRSTSAVLADMLMSGSPDLALSALGRALCEDDQASTDDVMSALAGMNADVVLKVRAAEQRLLKAVSDTGETPETFLASQAQRGALYDDLVQKSDDDRQRAREHQRLTHDNTNRWLAIGITIGFFAVLLLLIVGKPAGLNTSDAVVQTLLGVLGTGWVSVISYYFGSSVGSKEKTALLDQTVSAATRQRSPPAS